MPNTNLKESFHQVFRQAQAGGFEALQTFFDKYADAILMAVRGKMNSRLRSAFDSTDFMQQAQLKLHACGIQDKHFETPEHFMAYMVKIAVREVQQEKRKRWRQNEINPHDDKPLDALSPGETAQLVDREPAPDVLAAAEEQWRLALEQLPLVSRHIAIRLREGCKHREIAEELKISERTVRRVVVKLAELLGVDR